MEIDISKNTGWLKLKAGNEEVAECMIVGIEYESRYAKEWEKFKNKFIEILSKEFNVIGRIDALDKRTMNYIIKNCKEYNCLNNQSIVFRDSNQCTVLKYAFCEGLNTVLNETYMELMDIVNIGNEDIAEIKLPDIYKLPNFKGEILLTGDDTLFSIRLINNELANKTQDIIINIVQEVCQQLKISVNILS